MINLGKLKEIKDLRKVWPHEALDFTPWLAEEDNLTLLADAVGLAITVDETESGVGDFNVDIYATETGTDRKIIIENQQTRDSRHGAKQLPRAGITFFSIRTYRLGHPGRLREGLRTRCY